MPHPSSQRAAGRPALRTILVYGAIAGTLTGALFVAALTAGSDTAAETVWFGYLIMLITLSLIFVGVKRFRDNERGGVVSFWTAAGVGSAVAGVAALIYAGIWEAHLAATDYAFIDAYVAKAREGLAADDAQHEKITQADALYRNPVARFFLSISEILPVGLLVAFVSAALLRNPAFLPARSA